MTTVTAPGWMACHATRRTRGAAVDRECCVRIGPCDIRVRGDHVQALDDFAHLYADCLIDQPQREPRIDLTVARTPERYGLRRRYRIASCGETLFDGLRPGEVLPYLEWAVNYRLITTCLRFVLVHAATVAWGGRGVALIGSSGSGKSTLAAVLVARGARYLCDEFAMIDPETLELHPFPRALCVKSGSFAIVRRLGLPLWRRRCHVKAFKGRVGYVRSCHLNPARESVPLEAVIFPSFTGDSAPRLHAMPRSQVAFSIAAGVLNSPSDPQSAAATASRIAARATGHALSVGPIDATAGLVVDLLEGSRTPSPALVPA